METKSLFKHSWIFEQYLPGELKGILVGVEAKKKLYEARSPHQTIDIFDTVGFGTMLFLDGSIQLSSKTEAVYHEMLVHPSLCAHPLPKKILLIGGGDGGALREIVKHNVQEVIMVEIDEMVIKAVKKYMPHVPQKSFEDPRVSLRIGDGAEFIKHYKNYFDCIVLDSTDPDGNASKPLFKKKFFENVKKALKPNGIFSAQTGCISDPFSLKTRTLIRSIFPFFQVRRAFVSCFPADEHSFSFASSKVDLAHIRARAIEQRYLKRKIRTSYFSPKMYSA